LSRSFDQFGVPLSSRRSVIRGAVVDGRMGFSYRETTGFDYGKMTIPDGVVEQAEQCLKNIEAALRAAGASLADVVRVTYMLPDSGRVSPVLADLEEILRQRAPGGDNDLRGVWPSRACASRSKSPARKRTA